MNIQDYLDKEKIPLISWEDIEKIINEELCEEERIRFNNAFNAYETTPWSYENNQNVYTLSCELILRGIPIINYLMGLDREETEKTAPIILDHIKKNKLTLDVGSGIGVKTKFFAENIEGEIIGIDINGSTVRLANTKKRNNMKYVKGNFYFLPFKDNQFDCVLFCNAIQESGTHYGNYMNSWYEYHIHEKVSELSRVIKKNGKLILEHNGYDNFPDEVKGSMEDCGVDIKENFSLMIEKADKKREHHIVVGIKR